MCRIGKCQSIRISRSVIIVSKEKLVKMAPPSRKFRNTRNSVNSGTSKAIPEKQQVSEKNDSEVASESGASEYVKLIESAVIEMGSEEEATAPGNEESDHDELEQADDKDEDWNAPGTSASNNVKSRKRKSSPDKKPQLKKDLEFEDKRKVAVAVSKYGHLYDVRHPKFYDKRLENAAWKAVSDSVKLPVNDCIKHWTSLKRSANYFARPTRIPFKSGAGANELDEKKYKDEWKYAEVMSFYTPPALKQPETLISVCNTTASNEIGDLDEVLFETNEMEASTMDTVEFVGVDNIYVSFFG